MLRVERAIQMNQLRAFSISWNPIKRKSAYKAACSYPLKLIFPYLDQNGECPPLHSTTRYPNRPADPLRNCEERAASPYIIYWDSMIIL